MLFFRSHLIVVPPGPNLTEALRTSPIIQGEDGYTPAGDFGSGFDVDPNLDPELALVYALSFHCELLTSFWNVFISCWI